MRTSDGRLKNDEAQGDCGGQSEGGAGKGEACSTGAAGRPGGGCGEGGARGGCGEVGIARSIRRALDRRVGGGGWQGSVCLSSLYSADGQPSELAEPHTDMCEGQGRSVGGSEAMSTQARFVRM